MSRFFRGGDDSSESEDEQVLVEEVAIKKDRFGAKATFSDSDSDSEDEKRVVKSAHDKAWDSMRERNVKIYNSIKTNDWSAIQDEFEAVNKMVEKSKMLIIKEGLPKFYIKMLADLEDHLGVTLKDKELQKKMKPVVTKALNRMKLSLRKHNKTYEIQINDFRSNPDNYVEEEQSESDDDDDDSDEDSINDDDDTESSVDSDKDSEDGSSEEEDLNAKPKAVSKPKSKQIADHSDSEDSLFGDDDSESDSEDDEKDGRPELKGRKKWELKKEVVKTLVQQKTKKPKPVAGSGVAVVSASSSMQVEEIMTEAELDKKVNELVASRGKKSTDPKDVIRKLEVLSKVARVFSPKKEIPVLMHLVSTMFGSHRVIDDYMDLSQWRTCSRCLNRIVTLLDENKNIILSLMADEDLSDLILGAGNNSDFIKSKEDNDDEEVKVVNKNEVKVVGSLETFLVRLEDEYTKSLQQINPHTQDYVVRLSDEAMLVELAQAARVYYRRVGDERSCAAVALLIVEHLYYKHDTVAVAVQKAHIFSKSWGKYSDLHPACKGKMEGITLGNTKNVHPACFLGNPTVVVPAFNSAALLEELCKSIFKYGDERNKTRALLCSVYHHALHDRYYRARDMFLISHIQDAIEKMDTKTQILYNRTLVTLGLSAFRQGLIPKAHDCLAGICTGRVRELLAQGQTRWHDKDPEQEKIERRRQMPYHMHINPDLLECVHLTCAMLLELPHMARGNTDVRSAVSRQFRKYLQSYNRQDFTGPPENTREHVLAAAKDLMAGEWQKACSSILGLEVWNLIPGDGGSKVKEMLNSRMKEEAVRIYLLKYGVHYESLSLAHICQMFDIEEVPTRKIISRMIFNKEISGAWEHPANTLVLYNIEPSSLQVLSQQVAEKVAMLVESNERVMDPLANSYGYKDDNWIGRQVGNDARTGKQQYYDNDRSRGTGGRGGFQQRNRTLPSNVTGRGKSGNNKGKGGKSANTQGGKGNSRGWGQQT